MTLVCAFHEPRLWIWPYFKFPSFIAFAPIGKRPRYCAKIAVRHTDLNAPVLSPPTYPSGIRTWSTALGLSSFDTNSSMPLLRGNAQHSQPNRPPSRYMPSAILIESPSEEV
eukprot:1102472-Amphidinium_carterae.1